MVIASFLSQKIFGSFHLSGQARNNSDGRYRQSHYCLKMAKICTGQDRLMEIERFILQNYAAVVLIEQIHWEEWDRLTWRSGADQLLGLLKKGQSANYSNSTQAPFFRSDVELLDLRSLSIYSFRQNTHQIAQTSFIVARSGNRLANLERI